MELISFEADDLAVEVAVTFDPRAPVQTLEGADCIAVARARSGGVTVAAVVEPPEAATLRLRFAPGSLAAGHWTLQVRVTQDGITQTVVERGIEVRRSFQVVV